MIRDFLIDNGVETSPNVFALTPGVMRKVADEFHLDNYEDGDEVVLHLQDGDEVVLTASTVH